MAKRMTLVVALMLIGTGGVCRGEGALADTIGHPASAVSKNPPGSPWARPQDPNRRMQELIDQGDLQRRIRNWERPWFVVQPSHMNYERIHGGLE